MNFIQGPIYKLPKYVCTFHALGLLAYSKTELMSDIMKPFRHFGTTPWMKNRPSVRTLPPQDSTTQRNMNASSEISTHNLCSSGPRPYMP